MKPPVEAPTSTASRPVTSIANASSAFASLWPARETYGGGLSTLQLGGFVDLRPGLVVARNEARDHERLRLRAALGEAAFHEQDVKPLLHEQ